MVWFDAENFSLVGDSGSLEVPDEDEITHKLAGPAKAAKKFNFSRQRYFQIRSAFKNQGALALLSQKRGPKRNYRRTEEVIRQVIRHRFLDPEASADVIAQKLRQCGLTISTRSVERIIEKFGLQKKTPPLSSRL